MSADSEPLPFLTTSETARLLRRTPDTILEWRSKGHLPQAGQLPDGGYLFEREAVMALARGRRQVKHAITDPAKIKAFVDAAWRRSKRA